MKIVTHPNNKSYIDEITTQSDTMLGRMGILRITGKFPTVFDSSLPEKVPSKTEFVTRHDRFCEYNATNPAEWEIFCGYVAPKMVPNFIMVEDRRSTFMGPDGPEVR